MSHRRHSAWADYINWAVWVCKMGDVPILSLVYSNSSCDAFMSPFLDMNGISDNASWACHFLWFHETMAALFLVFSLLSLLATLCCCCDCNFVCLFLCLAFASPLWEIAAPTACVIWCCCCPQSCYRLKRSYCCGCWPDRSMPVYEPVPVESAASAESDPSVAINADLAPRI